MTLFLVIGIVGLLLLAISLVLGEVLDGLLDVLDVGIPTPVIGAFLASFGFGSALILYSTDVGAGIAGVGGLASGGVVGGVAYVFTRSLMNMPTDDPIRSSDLVGKQATVVTRIPDEGLGEISLSFHGQLQKLGARSAQPVVAGAQVTIISVTSPSSVFVEPLE